MPAQKKLRVFRGTNRKKKTVDKEHVLELELPLPIPPPPRSTSSLGETTEVIIDWNENHLDMFLI